MPGACSGHIKRLGGLTQGEPLGLQIALLIEEFSAVGAIPAWVTIRVAALLLLDDGCHSDLLVASFALVLSWRRMARSPSVATLHDSEALFSRPPFRLSGQHGDRDPNWRCALPPARVCFTSVSLASIVSYVRSVSSIGNIKPLFPWHPRQRLPAPGCPPRFRTPPQPRAGRLAGRPAGRTLAAGRRRHRSGLGLGDRPERHHRRLQAPPRAGGGPHGGTGRCPDSSAMTRAARHVFFAPPTIVDTHAHLPHAIRS